MGWPTNSWCILYSVQRIVGGVHCTLYNEQLEYIVLCTTNRWCTLYSVQRTVGVHCTMYNEQLVYIVLSTTNTLYFVQRTVGVHCTLYTARAHSSFESLVTSSIYII